MRWATRLFASTLGTVILLAAQTANSPGAASSGDLQKEVAELRAMVETLQARVAQLEQKSKTSQGHDRSVESEHDALAGGSSVAVPEQSTPAAQLTGGWSSGTTLNLLFDGYYGFNFNNPIGRVNLLRSYDVSSNAFSLNQAALVLENAPDVDRGKRLGFRLDLQYGQATETLQGSSINEPRPDVYRNIFQAFGTYVFPIGKGLTVDFGKFASSLGVEGNYTKDQLNYSRGYLFGLLPFYHMGARVTYKVNNRIGLNYWITNGTQQTEPFNGFKDQFFGITLQPKKNLSWNTNYYLGQEHPNVRFYPNGDAPPGLPTEQGLPFAPIPNPRNGKIHIFDTYATWQPSPKWTLIGEADYVLQRLEKTDRPEHSSGGALYALYRIAPKWAVAARAEYLGERGGLYSGATQALRETTLTADYQLTNGFLMRGEWRRDFSNHPYFLTDTLGVLKKEQNTATLGLIWWFGPKQGNW